MAMMRFIRWILPLLVVLTIIVVAFALVATGTIGAHAAGVTPNAYWHW